MRWTGDFEELDSDKEECDPCSMRDIPEHECGEINSVARFSRVNGTYFIGCFYWPKCQYSRPATFPEDEIKIARLRAIHNVTQRS